MLRAVRPGLLIAAPYVNSTCEICRILVECAPGAECFGFEVLDRVTLGIAVSVKARLPQWP
jgi:hypothetical protein